MADHAAVSPKTKHYGHGTPAGNASLPALIAAIERRAVPNLDILVKHASAVWVIWR
jgi:hypothetical protein